MSTPPNRPPPYTPRPSLARTIRENVFFVALATFFVQFAVGLSWVWETLLWPVLRPIWRGFKWLFRRYMRLWDRVVYLKTGHFSRVRAGLMVTATLIALYLFVPVVVFVGEAMLFIVTYDSEEVYLTGSQEIDTVENIHNVKGCETANCTPETALYYRVQDSTLNSVWSWVVHWQPFYADFVAASAGSGFSKCTVKSYGVRWRILTRNLEWYPNMLEASCTPVGYSAPAGAP